MRLSAIKPGLLVLDYTASDSSLPKSLGTRDNTFHEHGNSSGNVLKPFLKLSGSLLKMSIDLDSSPISTKPYIPTLKQIQALTPYRSHALS